MKPGEYVGADGRTYRWTLDRLDDGSATGYYHEVLYDGEWLAEWINPADWPAARAALAKEILEEIQEYVNDEGI